MKYTELVDRYIADAAWPVIYEGYKDPWIHRWYIKGFPKGKGFPDLQGAFQFLLELEGRTQFETIEGSSFFQIKFWKKK